MFGRGDVAAVLAAVIGAGDGVTERDAQTAEVGEERGGGRQRNPQTVEEKHRRDDGERALGACFGFISIFYDVLLGFYKDIKGLMQTAKLTIQQRSTIVLEKIYLACTG